MNIKFFLGPFPLLKVLNLSDPDDQNIYKELENKRPITEISAIYNPIQINSQKEWVIVARGKMVGFIGACNVISGSMHRAEYEFTPLGKVFVWYQYFDKKSETQLVYMTRLKKL